jgi:hypothetical protein
MTEACYTLKDVASILHTEPYRIVYQLSTHKVADVPRIGGRRIFSLEDVQRIATALEIEMTQELKEKNRRES